MISLLVVSNIVLWVTVIALAVVVFALVRQIGVLYERIAPAGALSVNQQLSAGQASPELDVVDLGGNQTLHIGGAKRAKSQLLFFVSPSCPVCKSLIPIAKSISKAEQGWIDLIFASDGDETSMQTFIAEQQLENEYFVNSEILGKTYGVAKLPYAVLIDESGTLQAMGIVNSREHIESLFNVKETGYANLQEYMQKNFA